jgi:hypothetical protein
LSGGNNHRNGSFRLNEGAAASRAGRSRTRVKAAAVIRNSKIYERPLRLAGSITLTCVPWLLELISTRP